MEHTSLHLLDLSAVAAYVAVAEGRADPTVEPALARLGERWTSLIAANAVNGSRRAGEGDEEGANVLTYGLGQLLAASGPSFFHAGVSLTAWEARIDRGVGMLMRPPSRLFIDAGMTVEAARRMPIRLDLARGMMGGAFIPARLVPDFERLLETRLERSVRRLIDAELDAVAVMGLMVEVARTARERGMGLYEASDVIAPDAPEAMPPGVEIVIANRKRIDPALRKRLETASKPPKKPGLLARMMGRGGRSGNGLAHYPHEEAR